MDIKVLERLWIPQDIHVENLLQKETQKNTNAIKKALLANVKI